jgi:hypothetical protein
MKTTVVDKDLKCPICNYSAEQATSFNDNSKPKPGDLAMCINCSSLNEYELINGKMKLIPVNESTVDKLKTEAPGIYHHVMKLREAIKTTNTKD